ncbi:MAG: hypothetical protein LBQ66_11555 [Planctomycetaceae bacterium]|jgi:hypothetical protein|nr:hypothetical protein [Planctomycetaceae bacterium]
MLLDDVNIEEIVRSVLFDLRIDVKSDKADQPAVVRDVGVNVDSGEVGVLCSGELSLEFGRVISVEDIRRRLDGVVGVRRLVVSPKSILTPSAKDEIRNRKLEIVFRKIADVAKPLWFARHGNAVLSPFAMTRLQSEYDLIQNNFDDFAKLIDEADKIISLQKNCGVVLTEFPATAIRDIGLRESLRVILAIDPKQTAIDTKEINANVMIISPHRISESNILESIKRFRSEFVLRLSAEPASDLTGVK